MTRSRSGGTSGFRRTGGTGARLRIASTIVPVLSPRNGRVPVAVSYSTTPNENKSVRASNGVARTCSGDIYDTVPSVLPGSVNSAARERVTSSAASAAAAPDVAFASPKSRIFGWPRVVRKMFAGLMSRWTMPLLCAASSASPSRRDLKD